MSNKRHKKVKAKSNPDEAILKKWQQVQQFSKAAQDGLQQIIGMGEALGYDSNKMNNILGAKVLAEKPVQEDK